MSSLERRLERLEAASVGQEVPWWGLPTGKEPDWPRPLADWSDEGLEELSSRDIEEYCDALDEGREYSPSYEEVWLNQEVFHQSRWRKYGIVRRSEGMPPPKEWDVDEYPEIERRMNIVCGRVQRRRSVQEGSRVGCGAAVDLCESNRQDRLDSFRIKLLTVPQQYDRGTITTQTLGN